MINMGKVKLAVASAAGVFASAAAFAEETSTPVTLPDTGINMSSYVTAGITAIGAVIAVVIGGYFAFLLIRKGMKWAGRALG